MIEPEHPGLSVTKQCELLGLPRSSYYHVPAPELEKNLSLMRVIDETYLAYPFFGSRQMTRWLRRQGHDVNRKRVQRLMRKMGIAALGPKPRTRRWWPLSNSASANPSTFRVSATWPVRSERHWCKPTREAAPRISRASTFAARRSPPRWRSARCAPITASSRWPMSAASAAPSTMSAMMGRGVDGLITDKPGLAKKVLAERAATLSDRIGQRYFTHAAAEAMRSL